MADIIRCKDCKYLQKWRSNPEVIEKYGQIYECSLDALTCPSPDSYCSMAKRKEDHKFGKWIPVSERLPEIVEWYLTSIKWDDGTERVIISWFDGMSFKAEVIAWMPLPQPYKAESDPWEKWLYPNRKEDRECIK